MAFTYRVTLHILGKGEEGQVRAQGALSMSEALDVIRNWLMSKGPEYYCRIEQE